MTPRTLSYQTFAEIARETAKKRHGESWRVYSDDILSSLIYDFWCGCFIDSKGESCTFDLSHRQGGTYQSIAREIVWRTLGFNKPRIVSNFWGENPPPWDFLATAKIEDYGSGVRTLFENLALSVADAGSWMKQYKKLAEPSTGQQSEKRGRKPQYDWTAFLYEIIEIAAKGELPEKQAELEERMMEWCQEKWGTEPSVSIIREHVKKLYPRP